MYIRVGDRGKVIIRFRVNGIISMRVMIIMVSVRIMMKVKTKGFVLTMLWLQFKWGFC